jgi:pterin-4a-carbinolamine dehydratase
MQRGVRSYANSFVDILKENESEGFREVNSAAESVVSSADTSAPKQQSMGPLEVQDLPEIPPLPTRPTSHISLEDVTTYIQPLVSHQWKVGHIRSGISEDEVLSLDRHYKFKGFNDVMDFVQGVADISRAEKHHARITIEYNTVDISSHTHSAYTFHHVGKGKTEPRKVPGLTRRDIRFAIKVEELHETFKERGRTMEFVSAAFPHLQRQSMKSVLRRYSQKQAVAEMEDGPQQ